ncbi:hypothetical protein AAC387_Pa02g5112 [Persea americana]
MEIGVESVAVGCCDYSSSWLLAVVRCSGDDDRWCQVALRWIYQQGASVIVKCFNKERMKENLEIFDWELSDEELLKSVRFHSARDILENPSSLQVGHTSPSKSFGMKKIHEITTFSL